MDQDLLAHTRASPDDLAVRLVLADALEDSGEIQRARFVREQCAREPDGLHSRLERALWQHFGERWIREDIGSHASSSQIHYQKGLPAAVRLPLREILDLADVLARYPIQSLALSRIDSEQDLLRLADHPLLETVTCLALEGGLEEVQAPVLARLLAPARLTELVFRPYEDAPGAMEALDEWPESGRLEVLRLHGVAARDSLWPELSGLRSLEITGEGTSGALRALAQSPLALDSLALVFLDDQHGANDTDRDAVVEVLLAPGCARLRSLCLTGSRRAGLIDAFGDLPCASGLERLELAFHEDPALLRSMPPLPSLRWLDISQNGLTDASIAPLLRDDLGSLRVLRAYGNRLTAAGAAQLLERHEHLEELDLDFSYVGDPCAEAIAASPHARKLRRLGLRGVGLGPRGALALAGSPHLRQLRGLDIADNDQLDAETLRAILGAPFEDMERLELDWEGLELEGRWSQPGPGNSLERRLEEP